MAETPEERKKRLYENMMRGKERVAAEKAAGTYVKPPRRKPKNLDKIIREILDDDELIDKVVANQPDYWNRLPVKNGAYIISTVMMVKAMGGDTKAADWIRKSGYGDKVQLESSDGFFQKSEFTIQVLPAKSLDTGISSTDVLDNEIKQIEE